jgi:hypothetical protein
MLIILILSKAQRSRRMTVQARADKLLRRMNSQFLGLIFTLEILIFGLMKND